MKRQTLAVLALAVVLMIALPAGAEAGAGSTIFERFWDSLTHTFTERLRDQTPFLADLLHEGEENFVAVTDDLTTHPAVRDVVRGMQYVGLLVLAFCFVLSLSELATGALLGGYHSLANWFWRLLVATLMTFGTVPVYGLVIRSFNALVLALRQWLDAHWTHVDTGGLLAQLLDATLPGTRTLLLLVFVVMFLLVCLALWFLMGGVRVAELAVYLILAPVVWPLYLLPAVDDIPKTAFRGFLGINVLLLAVVAMLRLSVRWVVAGGLAGTFWNFIPAISLLGFTLFLPGLVKRIAGQGQSGLGVLTTMVKMAAGLRLVGAAAAAGAASGVTAAPPAAAGVPPTAAAPVSAGGGNLVAAPPPVPPGPPGGGGPPPDGGPPGGGGPRWQPTWVFRRSRPLQPSTPWKQIAASAEAGGPMIFDTDVHTLADGKLRVIPKLFEKYLFDDTFDQPGQRTTTNNPATPRFIRYLLDDDFDKQPPEGGS